MHNVTCNRMIDASYNNYLQCALFENNCECVIFRLLSHQCRFRCGPLAAAILQRASQAMNEIVATGTTVILYILRSRSSALAPH